MTMLHVFAYLMLQLAIQKTIDSLGYDFPVYPTEMCPMTAKGWSDASIKLECNDTHGYHCVPDKNFSSLIQFCYPRGRRIPFQKGNCLELAYTGILNHVKCENFTYGCPEKDYFSNEIYRYPACLRLVEKCFAADLNCLQKRYSMIDGREKNCTCIREQSLEKENISKGLIVAVVFLSVLFLIMCGVVSIQCLKIRKLQRSIDAAHKENEPLIGKITNAQTQTEAENESLSDDIDRKDAQTQTQRGENDPVIEDTIRDNITKEILAEYTIENAQLFSLLKQQCKIGGYNGFHHLLSSRVQTKEYRRDILRQRDKDGLTLLNYAAIGGSTRIFGDILQTDKSLKVDVKCSRGQTALHYAIREGNEEMSIYLITKYEELLCGIKTDTKQRPEIDEDSEKKITQSFEPIHWIAWIGNLTILETLKRKDMSTQSCLDMAKTTRNGLNILHIACLANDNNFCKHVIENENQIDIFTTDACGWNAAHFAARANNYAFLDILKQCEKEDLVNVKTECGKTTLHVACEYANEDVVDFLLKNHKTLLNEADELEWNALHYATKGGNLKILKKLISCGLKIDSLTKEEKTLLHVACIHKQVNICSYVVNEFVKAKRTDLINKKTTNYKWLAVHYLGVERAGHGREKAILDILYNCKMDLKGRTGDGHSILDIAVEHANEELVDCILSENYIKIMAIDEKNLKKAKDKTNNEKIKMTITKALEKL